jgi:hypothetical protein
MRKVALRIDGIAEGGAALIRLAALRRSTFSPREKGNYKCWAPRMSLPGRALVGWPLR